MRVLVFISLDFIPESLAWNIDVVLRHTLNCYYSKDFELVLSNSKPVGRLNARHNMLLLLILVVIGSVSNMGTSNQL